MSQPYIGEIRLFGGNFAPAGWLACAGQVLAISQYETLYALIGTTYGGDGQTTFRLPDLQGRVPVHQGTQSGRTFVLGETAGTETVTLTTSQIPAHTHTLRASGAAGIADSPSGRRPAVAPDTRLYGPAGGATVNLAASTIGASGGSQPHENMQPTTAVTFIIATQGVFPSQS